MHRAAFLVVVALALAGCSSPLELTAATVPDKFLEGQGGNGWAKNSSSSQKEPVSSGAAKEQTLVYEDKQSSAGYPGYLSVTTLRTLLQSNEEKLRDTMQERVRTQSAAKGIKIQDEPARGTRAVAGGATSFWFVYTGTVESTNFFSSQSAQVKVMGEVWPCSDAREVVIVVGLAQTTNVRTIGGVFTQSNPDDTTWREIVSDPGGKLESYRGSNGLAYNVVC